MYKHRCARSQVKAHLSVFQGGIKHWLKMNIENNKWRIILQTTWWSWSRPCLKPLRQKQIIVVSFWQNELILAHVSHVDFCIFITMLSKSYILSSIIITFIIIITIIIYISMYTYWFMGVSLKLVVCWIACYLMLFSTLLQSYWGSQCTYPYFHGVLLTSTLNNILSNPLAAFPHNHHRNNAQYLERNESCCNEINNPLHRLGTSLTLSQTSPGFNMSAMKVFWKHSGKRRNCS